MQQQAFAALVAWTRLEQALAAYEAELKRRFGVTRLQLGVLNMLTERPHLPLAALRKGLVVHAATLGQSIDELRRKGLVFVRTDPADRRARLVGLTEAGTGLMAEIEVAGPARLRGIDGDRARLDRLAEAFADAVDLFGLQSWVPGRKPADPDQ